MTRSAATALVHALAATKNLRRRKPRRAKKQRAVKTWCPFCKIAHVGGDTCMGTKLGLKPR